MTDVAYVELCDEVIRRARTIAAKCATGKTDEAGNLAALLCDVASTAKHQHLMQQEQAAEGYDLKALHVDLTLGSNSETGYEDRG